MSKSIGSIGAKFLEYCLLVGVLMAIFGLSSIFMNGPIFWAACGVAGFAVRKHMFSRKMASVIVAGLILGKVMAMFTIPFPAISHHAIDCVVGTVLFLIIVFSRRTISLTE